MHVRDARPAQWRAQCTLPPARRGALGGQGVVGWHYAGDVLDPSHAPEKPIPQRATIVPSEGFFTSGMAEARKALDHGFPYAAIVLAYAVTEGVLNFVCERRLQPKCRGKKYLGDKAACLHKSRALSDVALAAVLAVHGSRDERNNFLHFNATVETQPDALRAKAEGKCAGLEALLADLFAYDVKEGVVQRKHPEVWPKGAVVGAYIDFTATWEEWGRRAKAGAPDGGPPPVSS